MSLVITSPLFSPLPFLTRCKKCTELTSVNVRFGNTDVKYFVEQAMRLNNDPSRMPTVIGSVHCAGENSPLVEWKVGLTPSGASPAARTSVLGVVAVALVAIMMA